MKAVPVVLILFLSGYVDPPTQADGRQEAGVTVVTLTMVDQARQRPVPVVIYSGARPQGASPGLAVISHGYGGANTDYSFIATYLVSRGYVVASVQHEMPGDEPLPTAGPAFTARKPSWERGVKNILFVLGKLKETRPSLDYERLLLVGHSHGGDTSLLFAQEHPTLVNAVISLDNRRMPIPRRAEPRVLSIRSSDQRADDGVVPSLEEQIRLGVTVITLKATKHDDMWDGGTEEQKAEIVRHIGEFLRSIDPSSVAREARCVVSGDHASIAHIGVTESTKPGAIVKRVRAHPRPVPCA